ncbi:Shedu immune nuclease family protein [Sphingobacterium yanglingense]|uniref:Uncharacterized protein DUF4263 n=1 Tax=Sphingobacterium yanglingense TaxID=1437280 RepID=A0A4R6WLT1_9SPHI|nr:Shedu immune nuclease family protein [Sphingobacterium yanglingense]TDQ79758.1 uncharacterized protein DUF4263 [Sphingobacterium yanglingense]
MAKTITQNKPEEYLKNRNKTKEIYFFKDIDNGIDQISREVFLNRDKEIHYPTPYKGKSKYINIDKFTYIGFEKKLPVGINKVSTFGYGFTKTLRPLGEFLDQLKINEVVIEKNGKVEIDIKKHVIYLSDSKLNELNKAFTSLNSKQKSERERTSQQYMHDYFPNDIEEPLKNYTSGALASTLLDWGNSMSEFSETDKQSIKNLFEKLTLLPNFFSETSLAKTKEIIDNKFINAALKDFDKIFTGTSDTLGLEKKWQKFLKDHSWIFSTLFAYPVILYQDEAYVGGNTVSNRGGKYNDFLIKGGLSNNVSFVEIKTHLTNLLQSSPYRGDNVFAASKELSGCIGQVLNQRDQFQKSYFTLMQGKNDIQTFNPKALVLIGNYSALKEEQKGAFELFRSNSKDVDILTFDELRIKIESLQKIITGNANKPTVKKKN